MRRLWISGIVLLGLLSFSYSARAGAESVPDLFESSFAYETAGNYDRALNDALMILRQDTGHYVATLRVAWLHYLRASYADSISFYKKAVALQPKAMEPKLGLMLPLMAAKQWLAAEKLGEELLAKERRSYLVGSRMAFIFFSQGKYAKALARYQAVLADYPGDLEMMLGLGWTYLRMGRKAEAKRMFDQVLGIRKGNLNARTGLETLAALP